MDWHEHAAKPYIPLFWPIWWQKSTLCLFVLYSISNRDSHLLPYLCNRLCFPYETSTVCCALLCTGIRLCVLFVFFLHLLRSLPVTVGSITHAVNEKYKKNTLELYMCAKCKRSVIVLFMLVVCSFKLNHM